MIHLDKLQRSLEMVRCVLYRIQAPCKPVEGVSEGLRATWKIVETAMFDAQ